VTLRLRLTLFYTLLVAVILAASGVSLHFLFRRNLYQTLDNSLQEAANLLGHLTLDPEEAPALQDEEDNLQLPADLTALLFDNNGNLLDSLGRLPQPLPSLAPGFSTLEEWRSYAEPVSGGTLVLLRETATVRESLRQFDLSSLILAPCAVSLAFVLGYALAGRALNPVGSLTKAAYDLAERRAWNEVLPEPKQQDELWQLAKATNTLLQTLARVIETERRFTADAAHELRTPLTVLQGRLEQALERNRDPHLEPLLSKSQTALEDLLTLVEKFLLLARTEAGQGLTKEVLDLNEVIFNLTETLRPSLEGKGLKLSLELSESSTVVRGDPLALELLFKNLLENACKFTERGEIKVKVRREHRHVFVIVEDSGVGLSVEALPHVFERFYQADVKHRQQGSGLGLAIVQSIALWHGGTVVVENRVEGGSRFTVSLPTTTLAEL
jgi:two-component system, OmpR family, sensor kinase